MATAVKHPAAFGALVTAALLLTGFRPRSNVAVAPPRHAISDVRGDHRPARSWFATLRRIAEDISRQRIVLVAAGVTFYTLLALFPAIAAMVALYGLVADPATIADHVVKLSGLLPGGAINVIHDEINRIAGQPRGTLGLAFALGLVVSLWSANGGMKALFDALNVVYAENETRSFVRANAVSLAFVLGGILFVLILIAGVVAVPAVLRHLGIAPLAKSIVSIARWPVLFGVVAIAVALIYRFGPDRSRPKWRWITWGSALASVGWLAVSLLFSWYAEHFGSYNKTYGSLGAVIGFMTWIWLSTIVVLIGAEVDAIFERQMSGKGREREQPVLLERTAS